MKTWGIAALILGLLLAVGLPIVESSLGWGSYLVNILKLIGFGLLAVGIVLLCKRKKPSNP